MVFFYILIDDSLELHEYLGFKLSDFITRYIELGLGSTAGELVVFGLFGLLLFTPLGWYFYKNQNKDLKIVSQDLFILFAAMLFFGIGVDVLHDFARTGTVLNGFLGLLQDGGETIVRSLIVWYTWTFTKQDPFFKQTAQHYRKKDAKLKTPKERMPRPIAVQRQKAQSNKKSA